MKYYIFTWNIFDIDTRDDIIDRTQIKECLLKEEVIISVNKGSHVCANFIVYYVKGSIPQELYESFPSSCCCIFYSHYLVFLEKIWNYFKERTVFTCSSIVSGVYRIFFFREGEIFMIPELNTDLMKLKILLKNNCICIHN